MHCDSGIVVGDRFSLGEFVNLSELQIPSCKAGLPMLPHSLCENKMR